MLVFSINHMTIVNSESREVVVAEKVTLSILNVIPKQYILLSFYFLINNFIECFLKK